MHSSEKRRAGRFGRFGSVYRLRILCVILLSTIVFPVFVQSETLLPVQRVRQEHGRWCWAASTLAIINRFGTWPAHGDGEGQCAIVNWEQDKDYCCDDPDGNNPGHESCNQNGPNSSIVPILENWGIDATRRERALDQSECGTEINAGRPFAFRWGWDDGGGHLLVGLGVSDDLVTLYYMDPTRGDHGGYWQAGHSWVVEGDNHEWTDTFETNDPAGATVRLRHTFNDDNYTYTAIGSIIVDDFEVRENRTVLESRSRIHLRDGFEVEEYAKLEAYIIDHECSSQEFECGSECCSKANDQGCDVDCCPKGYVCCPDQFGRCEPTLEDCEGIVS